MEQYSKDPKFSKAISECFAEIGEYQFVNPISSYPWGGRNRVIARIQVFEKYLTPEDVLHARWLQQHAVRAAPKDWSARDTGIVYLNELMDARSNGTFRDELDAIARELPSLMDYMKEEFGYPTSSEMAVRRRARMHTVSSDVTVKVRHPGGIDEVPVKVRHPAEIDIALFCRAQMHVVSSEPPST